MEKIIIKPIKVKNQYLFTLPDNLEKLELEFVLKIHYKPEKHEQKKRIVVFGS